MGTEAARYAFKVRGLGKVRSTFLQLAWSCMDETGLLMWNRERLASELECTMRTIEAHLPILAGLGLVTEGAEGFRLVEYIQRRIRGDNQGDRNNFGNSFRNNYRKNFGPYKEGFQGNLLETPPNPPQAGGVHKLTRDERRRAGMYCERPAPFTGIHLCRRCEVDHEWACKGVTCFCGCVRVYSCDVAIAAVRGKA